MPDDPPPPPSSASHIELINIMLLQIKIAQVEFQRSTVNEIDEIHLHRDVGMGRGIA